jgi:hypothetical protein
MLNRPVVFRIKIFFVHTCLDFLLPACPVHVQKANHAAKQ